MLQGAHVFSHQAFGHNEPSWMQSHHQTHHAQQAAAQAATTMAHAQHYNRLAANHNSGPSYSSNHGQDSGMMDGVTEENRRVLGWISDLLNEETRESALLELSKKREQVPELALILWHSFGNQCSYYLTYLTLTIMYRRHDIPTPGDNLGLHFTQSVSTHCRGLQSSVQCSRPLTVRCFTQ